MRYNDIVSIATPQQQLQTDDPPKVNECAATDCNRRIRLAHNRRMLLPHAQHRHNGVQRTYNLQQRRIHHIDKTSKPNTIKSNPASKAATQASVIKSQPPKHRCVCVNRNQSQIRIEFNRDPVESESNRIQSAGHRHYANQPPKHRCVCQP